MQNSTDPEITAWILRAMVKEGQKRDSKQRKKKKERKKNIKLIICTNFFLYLRCFGGQTIRNDLKNLTERQAKLEAVSPCAFHNQPCKASSKVHLKNYKLKDFYF